MISVVKRKLFYGLQEMFHCAEEVAGSNSALVFSGNKLKQPLDKSKAAFDNSRDEEMILEQLRQNGIHLAKIESVSADADGGQRLWLCPGLSLLMLMD